MSLSVSQIKLWNECNRRYKHVYIDNLAPKKESAELTLGSWIHEVLAAYYSGASSPIATILENAASRVNFSGDAERLERSAAILQGVSSTYPDWAAPKDNWKVLEVEKDRELLGVRCRPDLVVELESGPNQGLWVVEHKSVSLGHEGRYEATAAFDPQPTFYVAATGALGVIYNIIGKPAIRQRQDETPGEFILRIGKEYSQDPDKYYKRFYVHIPSGAEERARAMVNSTIGHMDYSNKTGYWTQSTNACHSFGICPFLPLCQGAAGPEDLYTVRESHG